jgi:hypothetical protein
MDVDAPDLVQCNSLVVLGHYPAPVQRHALESNVERHRFRRIEVAEPPAVSPVRMIPSRS